MAKPLVRSILINLLLFSLSLFFSLSCAYGYYYWKAANNPLRHNLSKIKLSGDHSIEKDAELGFIATPNASSRIEYPKSGVITNIYNDRLSARVNAPGDQTPKQVDILLVGGSFAWGHGMTNEETFLQQISNVLHLRVANFAFGSYGSVQSLLLMQRQKHLQPQLMIYVYIEDHLRRNLSPCAPSISPFCLPTPYVAFHDGVPQLMPPRLEFFSPAFDKEYFESLTQNPHIRFKDVWWQFQKDLFGVRYSREIQYENNAARRTEAFRFIFSQMKQTAKDANADLLVVTLPRMDCPRMKPVLPEIQEIIEEEPRGASFIDMYSALHERCITGDETELMLKNDGHPSPLAHRLIAEQLTPLVRSVLSKKGQK